MLLKATPSQDLAATLNQAKDAIDAAAGAARARYITVAPGQDATYQAKAADAEAYKTAGYPADTAPYPWVAAEARAQGSSGQAAADLILAMRDQWNAKGSQIEEMRINSKKTLDTLTTVSDVLKHRDQTIQSLSTL